MYNVLESVSFGKWENVFQEKERMNKLSVRKKNENMCLRVMKNCVGENKL